MMLQEMMLQEIDPQINLQMLQGMGLQSTNAADDETKYPFLKETQAKRSVTSMGPRRRDKGEPFQQNQCEQSSKSAYLGEICSQKRLQCGFGGASLGISPEEVLKKFECDFPIIAFAQGL